MATFMEAVLSGRPIKRKDGDWLTPNGIYFVNKDGNPAVISLEGYLATDWVLYSTAEGFSCMGCNKELVDLFYDVVNVKTKKKVGRFCQKCMDKNIN